jgi:hypothetical protein
MTEPQQVLAGYQADELAVIGIDDWNAAGIGCQHQIGNVTDRVIGVSKRHGTIGHQIGERLTALHTFLLPAQSVTARHQTLEDA